MQYLYFDDYDENVCRLYKCIMCVCDVCCVCLLLSLIYFAFQMYKKDDHDAYGFVYIYIWIMGRIILLMTRKGRSSDIALFITGRTLRMQRIQRSEVPKDLRERNN